ncbi:MAG: DUF7681 family protein [Burkholderiaceae bacterium]
MFGRFDSVEYSEEAKKVQFYFKQAMIALEADIEKHLEPGRAKQIALTKAEEMHMWIGKAIRDDQIEKCKKDGS